MIASPVGGFTMTKAGGKVPITSRALIQRINRKLAPDQETLKTARGALQNEVGEHYVLDLFHNRVTTKDVNLETLGRKLGVLKPWEVLR
jgi:hypothetical protein